VATGRQGGVFRAVQEEFDQEVALKVFPSSLLDDPEKQGRMARELRVSVEFDHPNVIKAYQLGKVGDVCYLALEDLQGQTLEDQLLQGGALDFELACRLMRDVGKGLAHIHGHEVIHRDIQPSNIWMTPNGVPKIMEFGGVHDSLAFLDVQSEGEELTTCETVIGDFEYMSPEQARDARRADTRSDFYSLGCTFYHCLTGLTPFDGRTSIAQAIQHATQEVRKVSELMPLLPHQIDDTITALLAKNPEDRFQNSQDVIWALDQYVSNEPKQEQENISVVPVSPAYRTWAQSQTPRSDDVIAPDAVGVTPELTSFLDWMSVKSAKKRKRR
jgi:serine/threonine protein kinase